jgi:hypothetical protein
MYFFSKQVTPFILKWAENIARKWDMTYVNTVIVGKPELIRIHLTELMSIPCL